VLINQEKKQEGFIRGGMRHDFPWGGGGNSAGGKEVQIDSKRGDDLGMGW